MRRNKYNAKKCKVYGITFDSIKEANRYMYLKSLQDSGDIRNLEVHPEFELVPGFVDRYGKKQRPIKYQADFKYIIDARIVVEDVKGGKATQTPVFAIKKKLFLKEYPHIDFKVIE
jgi:hypothetical protein